MTRKLEIEDRRLKGVCRCADISRQSTKVKSLKSVSLFFIFLIHYFSFLISDFDFACTSLLWCRVSSLEFRVSNLQHAKSMLMSACYGKMSGEVVMVF